MINAVKRDEGHVTRSELDVKVESQWKKMRVKRTWKKQVKEKASKLF